MQDQPLISIITIHYNHGVGLRRTVESILAQTERKAFEWIVIDGGSTDGSAEFLKGISADIDVLVSEKDGGIYDAMNKGLGKAQGQYVWFVNAGDALHDDSVVKWWLLQFVDLKKTMQVFCQMWYLVTRCLLIKRACLLA